MPALWLRRIATFARTKPLATVGALIILSFFAVAIFADQLAPHDPFTFAPKERLKGPSSAHWFGTDEFGRDVLSRVIFGTRISMKVGFLTVLSTVCVGSTIGVVSGYFGGWVDTIIQRFIDMLMAFPAIVLALAIVAARGQGTGNVIIALAVVGTPGVSRVVRANVLSLKGRTFVEAAQVVGASPVRIMAQHLLPNTFPAIIILATAGLGGAILAEATLSFLGLGTPPPNPSWGAMLSGNTRTYMLVAPWLVIFPGLILTMAIYSFNFLGDGLRDSLDPKLRGR